MSTGETNHAPYAASATITRLLDVNRERPIPRFDRETLSKLDVPASVIPRTMQALAWLGFITDDGTLTDSMLQLRRARDDEYRGALQEVIRAKYSDIFQYWQPGEPVEKVDSIFRQYEPMTMRPRMARLFLGLAAYSGMIAETEAPTPNANSGRTRKRTQAPRLVEATLIETGRRAVIEAAPPGAMRTMEHPLIRGLMDTLPKNVGDTFTPEAREAWKTLADATFGVLYKASPTAEGG